MTKAKLILVLAIFALLLGGCKSSDYDKAVQSYENKEYSEAITSLNELGDYKDSKQLLVKVIEADVSEHLNTDDGENVVTLISSYEYAYQDEKDGYKKLILDSFKKLIEKKDYKNARALYELPVYFNQR